MRWWCQGCSYALLKAFVDSTRDVQQKTQIHTTPLVLLLFRHFSGYIIFWCYCSFPVIFLFTQTHSLLLLLRKIFEAVAFLESIIVEWPIYTLTILVETCQNHTPFCFDMSHTLHGDKALSDK